MEVILAHYYDIAAVILFGIGFFTLLLHRNLIKKIIGLNIMILPYFFLASKGYIFGRVAPIVQEGVSNAEAYINPVPSGLVLTGIVVSVSVSAFSLALVQRLYKSTKPFIWMRFLCWRKRRRNNAFCL
ncbi:MAG: sodium:proton antiporter [Acutalibacteraceae bacterium]